MKNIITALNNPELNTELKKEKNINIINKDIIYKEGILEILEEKKEINLVIINYELPGKIKIEKLIEKIKEINENIELIFILEKENPEKEKILKKYNINNIYYNDKINKKDLINIINKKNKTTEEELKQEIEKLKKIIEEKNIENEKTGKIYLKKIQNKKQNKNEIINLLQKEIKFPQKKTKKNEEIDHKNSIHKTSKIKNAIIIHEETKDERSQLSLKILKQLKSKNKRILLVDLKINEEDLHIILNRKNALKQINNKIEKANQLKKEGGDKNKNQKEKIQRKNLEKNIQKNFFIKINKNIKLLTGFNYFFKNNQKNNEEKNIIKIINIIQNNSKKYDYLIIEISEKNNPELNKKIIEKTEKNIIIFSNNYENIKNTKEKIKRYEKINYPKIYLFLKKEELKNNNLKNKNININNKIKNKFNIKTKNTEEINIEIIKEIFKNIKIIKKVDKQFEKKILIN